eukprot:10809247-Lingulodinium_polyedra.AAC.1
MSSGSVSRTFCASARSVKARWRRKRPAAGGALSASASAAWMHSGETRNRPARGPPAASSPAAPAPKNSA